MRHSFTKRLLGRRGFTMTELLVVIAITGILLGLLFIPITQGFNLTRKAQNQIQAQTQARNGIQQLSRELSQASLVLDNSTAALNFPLSFSVNTDTQLVGGNPVGGQPTQPITWANGVTIFPARVLFAKIDFVPAGKLPSTGTKDPTTNEPMTGAQVRFPLAQGTRMVRYFIGLKDNTRPYQNVYQSRLHSPATASTSGNTEYPFQGDGRLNPFVLYRAEYDPEDPNLFDFSNNRANYNSAANDSGGFNDPNFFYNYRAADSTNPRNGRTGNGASYAANWKAISSAVVDGPNQDMITWVKDDGGDLTLTTPFRPMASFSPGSVTGDTATPAFLNATASEVPNAVPTMYEAQQGHWSLPLTLTFYRAASRPGSGDYGAMKVALDSEPQPGGITLTHVHIDPSATGGVLTTADDQIYCARIASTGEYFVKTPNLTFMIDVNRGVVKTGFPPLAGDPTTGAPLLRLPNGTIVTMAPGEFPDAYVGELVPTTYRINTRSLIAGTGVVPTNQGWTELNLWDDTTAGLRYFLAGGGPAVPLATATVGAYTSPMRIFGNATALGLQPGGGLLVAAGSEKVLGPDLSVTAATAMDAAAAAAPARKLYAGVGLLPYYRSPGALSSVVKKSTQIADTVSPLLKRWTPIIGQRTYTLDQDTRWTTGFPTAFLRFDTPNGPGLPAWASTDPNTSGPPNSILMERELQVTYLWQNNYARRVGGADNGQPVDAQGLIIGDKAMIAPEPDVVKVDYTTRDVLNVNLGVLVYDTNTRQGTNLNLNDRVRVGNTIR